MDESWSKSVSFSNENESTNKCDRELLKYVMIVINEIKKEKRICHVISINEQLKEKYGNIYPRVRQLSDKDLMKELDMAVKEGILSKRPRQTSKQATSDLSSTSPSSTERSSVFIYRLPRLRSIITDNQDEDEKNGTSDLLKLLIRTIAIFNKQNFNLSSDLDKSKSEIGSQMCTIEDIVKYMIKHNKLVLYYLNWFGLFMNQSKFYVNFPRFEARTKNLHNELKSIVFELMTTRKNQQLFLKKEAFDEMDRYMYRLNDDYITSKLKIKRLGNNTSSRNDV